jgi:hypothetical protein
MTEILDAIELELVGAVRRHNARARRRRVRGVAAGATAFVAVAATAGVATVVDTPLDTLFPSGARQAQPVDDAQSTVVVRDGGGASWSVTAYRSEGDRLSTTIVRRPRPVGAPPRVWGAAALLVAFRSAQSAHRPDVVTDAFTRGGTTHVVFGGSVDDAVEGLAITIGGERFEAKIADTVVTIPVVRDTAFHITPDVERRMPDEVRARAYAVTPEAGAFGDAVRLPATIETRLEDGVVATEQRMLCVSPRCAGP